MKKPHSPFVSVSPIAARPFSFRGETGRRLPSLGLVLLAMGFATSCGSDGGSGGTSTTDGDAGTTSGTTTTTTSSTNTTGGTSTTSSTNSTTGATTTTDTSNTTGTTTDTANPDTTTDTTTDTSPGTQPASDCGGAGQPCCAESMCNSGFQCVGADEPVIDPVGSDAAVTAGDAGVMALDAAALNQVLGDAATDAAAPPAETMTDSGVAATTGDASVGATQDGADGGVAPTGTEPPASAGMCEPCGGDGEQCCGGDTCSDGFACESSGRGPNATMSCTAVASTAGDAGADDGCGSLGELCCPGMPASCDDGLDCNNPPGPMGDQLANSECVDPAATAADSGAGPAAMDAAAPASNCGGEGQRCCQGGGGTCDDGLTCDDPAGQQLRNSMCVAP